MPRTIEAVIDAEGNVRPVTPVKLPAGRRALVTILDEVGREMDEAALLGEQALATDWNRPDEDAAWAHLQRER